MLLYHNAKSEKARNSAFIRWSKLKTDANALQTHSDRNAIKESIVKESKEKDRIGYQLKPAGRILLQNPGLWGPP